MDILWGSPMMPLIPFRVLVLIVCCSIDCPDMALQVLISPGEQIVKHNSSEQDRQHGSDNECIEKAYKI